MPAASAAWGLQGWLPWVPQGQTGPVCLPGAQPDTQHSPPCMAVTVFVKLSQYRQEIFFSDLAHLMSCRRSIIEIQSSKGKSVALHSAQTTNSNVTLLLGC